VEELGYEVGKTDQCVFKKAIQWGDEEEKETACCQRNQVRARR
jgi:hypothetical protein